MTFDLKTPVAAMTVALALGASGGAFAKAHDQGVADGDFPSIGTGELIQSLDSQGVSQIQNDGQRGDTASATGGDNAVDPVVGANEPD